MEECHSEDFEKLMLQMNTKNKVEEGEGKAVELDVSDEEMARRYEILVGTTGKKVCQKKETMPIMKKMKMDTQNQQLK